MEKKNPYKFTLGFDKTKPSHVRAAEILNSVKDKADLIASAVVAHIDGGRTEEGRSNISGFLPFCNGSKMPGYRESFTGSPI